MSRSDTKVKEIPAHTALDEHGGDDDYDIVKEEDFMARASDTEITGQLQTCGIFEAVDTGVKFPTRWPHPRISHTDDIHDITIRFTERLVLSEIVDAKAVVININKASLEEWMKGKEAKFPTSCGYDFVPHSIKVSSYDNRDMPIGWCVQLFSTDHNSNGVSWLPIRMMHSSVLAPAMSAFSVRRDHLCESVGTDRPHFVADQSLLNTDAWRRWAVLSKKDVLDELEDHYDDTKSFYNFAIPKKTEIATTGHPVLQNALLNIPAIVDHMEKSAEYHNFTKDDILSESNDGIIVKLPAGPIKAVLKTAFDTIKPEETMMRLTTLSLELVPDNGMGELTDWLQAREEMEFPVHMAANKFVHVSVDIHISGVFVPCK